MSYDDENRFSIGGVMIGFGFVLALIGFLVFWFAFHVRIEPGEVGIKVDMYGSDKGVEIEVLNTGRNFYNPITHDVIRYPAYIQQAEFENLQFQDNDGILLSADVAISYKFTADNIPSLYKEYRRDARSILYQYFPVWIKNAMVKKAAELPVDEIYGPRKEEYRLSVLESLKDDFEAKGISVENIYFTSGIDIPPNVANRIEEKIKATQIAQQKVNELAATQADVEKQVAVEEGKARSRLIEAESRAEANRILNASLTTTILRHKELEIQKEAIQQWNGVQPDVVTGGNDMLLDVSSFTK